MEILELFIIYREINYLSEFITMKNKNIFVILTLMLIGLSLPTLVIADEGLITDVDATGIEVNPISVIFGLIVVVIILVCLLIGLAGQNAPPRRHLPWE